MADTIWKMKTHYENQFDGIIKHHLRNIRQELACMIQFNRDENDKITEAILPKHIMDLMSPQVIEQLQEFAEIIS